MSPSSVAKGRRYECWIVSKDPEETREQVEEVAQRFVKFIGKENVRKYSVGALPLREGTYPQLLRIITFVEMPERKRKPHVEKRPRKEP